MKNALSSRLTARLGMISNNTGMQVVYLEVDWNSLDEEISVLSCSIEPWWVCTICTTVPLPVGTPKN